MGGGSLWKKDVGSRVIRDLWPAKKPLGGGSRGHRDLTQTAAVVVSEGLRGSQGRVWRQWVSLKGWPSEQASWQRICTEGQPWGLCPLLISDHFRGHCGARALLRRQSASSHVASEGREAAVGNGRA